jgi:hypothetical protein
MDLIWSPFVLLQITTSSEIIPCILFAFCGLSSCPSIRDEVNALDGYAYENGERNKASVVDFLFLFVSLRINEVHWQFFIVCKQYI